MPSKPWIVTIVLFWLVTTSAFFYRDLWPALKTGQPPPFSIDLSDEARRQSAAVSWSIQRGDKRIGELQTTVLYRDSDDTFELQCRTRNIDMLGVRITEMTETYRVTREGELREVTADGQLSVLGAALKAHVGGQVIDKRLRPRLQIESTLINVDMPIDPVDIAGSVLNPMHPVNRVTGLRLGQQWRLPQVDPLRDILASLVPGSSPGIRFLDAQVLPRKMPIMWKGRPTECFVIEYKSDDMSARTWVRDVDGLVLRQEATFQDDRLLLIRQE